MPFYNTSEEGILIVLTITENRLEKLKKSLILAHLNSKEKESLMKLVEKHQDRFHLPEEKLLAAYLIKHQIKVSDEKPIFVKQYRLPLARKREVQRQVKKILVGWYYRAIILPLL